MFKIIYSIIFSILCIIGFFYIIKNKIYYSPLWVLYLEQFSFIIIKYYNFFFLKMDKKFEMQLKYFSYGLMTSSLFCFLTSGGINSILLSTSYFALINSLLMFLKENSRLIYFFIAISYLILSFIANFFNSTYYIFFCLHYFLLFENYNKLVIFLILLTSIFQIIVFWFLLNEKIEKKNSYIIMVILNLFLQFSI